MSLFLGLDPFGYCRLDSAFGSGKAKGQVYSHEYPRVGLGGEDV